MADETAIEPGTHWTHNRNGYSVTVEELEGRPVYLKDPNDAHESKGVAYSRDDEDSIPIHVRTEADFLAKFTLDERLGDEA